MKLKTIKRPVVLLPLLSRSHTLGNAHNGGPSFLNHKMFTLPTNRSPAKRLRSHCPRASGIPRVLRDVEAMSVWGQRHALSTTSSRVGYRAQNYRSGSMVGHPPDCVRSNDRGRMGILCQKYALAAVPGFVRVPTEEDIHQLGQRDCVGDVALVPVGPPCASNQTLTEMSPSRGLAPRGDIAETSTRCGSAKLPRTLALRIFRSSGAILGFPQKR